MAFSVRCALLGALLFASAATADTLACAHRGDVAIAPENTLPAIRSAVEKGAHMIEFDVQRTKDGHLVLMHDGRIDRTTDGKGKVEDFTLTELKKLDAGSWYGPEFAGTKIPTLEETLAVIPKSILCNVHLKSGDLIAKATAELIEKMDRIEHCFLACNTDQIAEARAAVPEIQICNMTRQMGDRPGYIEKTIELDSEYIQLFYGHGTDKLKSEVEQLHKHGIRINWFGASEEKPIRELAEAGVDYILTDDLDLCLTVLADYDTEPVKTAAKNEPKKTPAQ